MIMWYGMHTGEALSLYAVPKSAAMAVLRDRRRKKSLAHAPTSPSVTTKSSTSTHSVTPSAKDDN